MVSMLVILVTYSLRGMEKLGSFCICLGSISTSLANTSRYPICREFVHEVMECSARSELESSE